MSTVSFAPPPSHPSPAYSRIPNDDERRIILRQPPTQPDSSFSKQSKSGSLTLTIYGQQPGLSLPVFGRGHDIHARVQLSKCDSVASVDLKVSFLVSLLLQLIPRASSMVSLRLREVGGAGASSDHILAQQLNLWSKIDSATCPSALDFDVQLETTYKKVNEAYPLPPTYDVHLSGLPGFRADVQYSITIVVTKSKGSLFGNHTMSVYLFSTCRAGADCCLKACPPLSSTILARDLDTLYQFHPTQLLARNGRSLNPPWGLVSLIRSPFSQR